MKFALVILVLCILCIAVSASWPWSQCDKQIAAETIEPNEEADIQATVDMSIQNENAAYEGKKYLRDAHPKSHGCVKAYFTVNQDLPIKYRVGVLAQAGQQYQAWIRYSNGNPKIQSDVDNDSRGMALKLMGVPGKKLLDDEIDAPTQDFVSANWNVFFLEKAGDYVGFFQAARKGAAAIIAYFVKGLKFLDILRVKQFTSNPIGNPVMAQYWSVTPYQLGEGRAIKFSFRAVDCTTGVPVVDPKPGTSANYLRERMTQTLSASSACFDFLVQEQTNPCEEPIEDPRQEWTSEFVKAARVTVLKQQFDTTQAELDFCENLSFTPWHSLPAHRPLGGINRSRKIVYKAISKLRHSKNGVPRVEPTSW